MSTVIEIVASVLSSGVGIALLIGLSIRFRLRKSNRLVAGRTSTAPNSWVWSPRRAAVLHRRLRACCQIVLHVATTANGSPARQPRRWGRRPEAAPGPFERIAAEMVAQAVDLDARLVLADQRGGVWRRHALAELAGEVRRLEMSSHRMEGLARTWQKEVGLAQPPTVADQLDALEAALGESPSNPSGTRGAAG